MSNFSLRKPRLSGNIQFVSCVLVAAMLPKYPGAGGRRSTRWKGGSSFMGAEPQERWSYTGQ